MQNESIISNQVILLSEDNESLNSIDVKFIICDFSVNGNNVKLNRDTAEEWIGTLVNMPLVGKVVKKVDGSEDFSGHNVKVVKVYDEETNEEYYEIEFDTQAFGSFYEVRIEEIDGVEYITAKAKVWKRYKKAFEVFSKRVKSKKGLKTSWEISVIESHNEKINGKKIKVIDKGEFIGHCCLGENIQPAYKSSGVIDVASEDRELIEALSEDMISELLNIKKYSEGGEQVADKNNQTSALTENDLYRKVRQAINNSSEYYYYVSMIFPYEYKAYAYKWERDKDTDFVEFSYVVNSDDTISITSSREVEMVFVPKSQIDQQISELQEKLNEAEKQIAEAGKLLTETNKEKEQLEAKIAELQPYKEKVEQLEQAERERELANKREELKSFALEDGLITSEELENDETIFTIIAELTIDNFEASKEKIDLIKGRRAIQKYKESKQKQPEAPETSEEKKSAENHDVTVAQTNLTNGDDDKIMASATDIIKSVIKRGK
jgi:hypothetical protein